jgi:hypothetical protein
VKDIAILTLMLVLTPFMVVLAVLSVIGECADTLGTRVTWWFARRVG